eukprot:TRINITY_DN829_c0_g1_i4.p1 TRINITY_DN829_c0_g1~~TRINITY_DN829_c0_g1_i4.p1  ORF type:complete len:890 (-),score=177.71 TRINITY_DN829_c0_g1_i4:182-2851(-)
MNMMRFFQLSSLFLISIAGTSHSYQTEFFLPYSETEDVDFSISRNDGCFQWSTDAVDIVSLSPLHMNYNKQCGNVLEFKVLAKAADPDKETIFKIFAENIDENIEPDVSSIFEYTIHVGKVARLEIMGLKTKLKISDPPVPYGVSGFDAEENEFDTLDGLQVKWFIGSEREVLEFNRRLENHVATTYISPKAAGKASIIAVLEDPNYSTLLPAVLELKVLSPLKVEPDGAFLLPGGEVEFKLFEEVASEEGGLYFKEVSVLGENPVYTFEIKDESVASLEKSTSLVTALKEEEDETTLLVKNREGEIIKQIPIRITIADSMSISAYPTPGKIQLLHGEEYEIKVEIFDKNKRPIHPSKNILCKTSYPGQFKVVELSENGLWARVFAVSTGRGRVKAHLRSVLTPSDEEIEITPHLRANVDFEVYSRIKVSPSITVLPWDDEVKPEYDMRFKITGGSKLYEYSVDDEEMGESLGNGMFRTRGLKAGSFNVRASMVNNEEIYGESEVHCLPPEDLVMDNHPSEIHMDSFIRIPIYMRTSIPGSEDRVAFNDCSDLPFKLQMTNAADFQFDKKDSRGSARVGGSCASIYVTCTNPGASSDIAVSYTNPITKKEFRDEGTFQCYKSLSIKSPIKSKVDSNLLMHLAIGSSSKAVLRDGPRPWFKEPSTFFRQVEIEDPDVIRVRRISKEDDYEENNYDVTCLAEGDTSFVIMMGNKASEENVIPSKESREIFVHCTAPKKLSMIVRNSESKDKVPSDSSSGKILMNSAKSIRLSLVVKDVEGNTYEGLNSVKFDIQISDKNLLKTKTERFNLPQFEAATVGKPYVDLEGQNLTGDVNVEVSIAGYDEDVFKSIGSELPKHEEEVDEELEDFEEYMDSVDIRLLSEEDLKKLVP